MLLSVKYCGTQMWKLTVWLTATVAFTLQKVAHGEWFDNVRMLIPMAPNCLLFLCNRSATAFEFRSSENRRRKKRTHRIFLKISSGKLLQDNLQTHTHTHIGILFMRRFFHVRISCVCICSRCVHTVEGRKHFFRRWKSK